VRPATFAVAPAEAAEDRVREAVGALLADVGDDRSPEVALGRQFDHGLAWVQLPAGLGGLGQEPRLQAVVGELLGAAGFPDPFTVNPIGYGMCGPTIAAWGTDEQKHRYLRPLFAGAEIWCQLFSEPGAGSDIAGLATAARPAPGGWRVTGQKVWTTMAHQARWGLLLARTDPDVGKHAGLTAFVLDMRAPGVDVRPLYQMTGEAEFNEVFLSDVFVPEGNLLGSIGRGWQVAITTLMNERVAIGGSVPPRGAGPIADLISEWLSARHRAGADAYADMVARLWIRSELLRITNLRFRQQATSQGPGPEGSIGKILSAELNQQIYSTLMELGGSENLLYPGGYQMTRPDQAIHDQSVQQSFLRSRANSIEGGTTEVMRNILAERVLGLPADGKTERGLPWNQIPRS